MLKEKPYRSIIKTITWRLLATLTTIYLVFIFTNELALSFGIGAIEVVAKLIFYYIHERVWDKINLGRINDNNEQ